MVFPRPHPFDPLSPEEINIAATIIRKNVDVPKEEQVFRVITLVEPPKKEMVEFLEKEHAGASPARPARVAMVQVYLDKVFHEFKLNLETKSVISKEALGNRVSFIDPALMQRIERACLDSPKVKERIGALDLPEGSRVIVEPWTYGTDGMNDMSKRIAMCWLHMTPSTDPDANYYAYPLDICVEVAESLEVLKIYTLPSGDVDAEAEDKPRPFDRRKLHSSSEYAPSLVSERRTTTRPYQVLQPEGPSFSIQGNHIAWEKWTMRVGFNYREGLTLHDIRYDRRNVFYRLSLTEMFVPYGDPRRPYPRKAAFDLGNDGAGVCANNLKLGCDCLGHIKYFDGWLTTSGGVPQKKPNVICCHEVDDGIMWKHTNYRTNNAVVTRSRLLVLQTIITVSNYEYIFLFYFGQDASIHYEVRATGILSTAPIDIGQSLPYGTVVAPGVFAPYHQHLFCLRIDPAIDGHKNSLVVEESVPLPVDDPEIHNHYGVGYITKAQTVPDEAGLDLDHTKGRVFKMVNESKINATTGTPVGYKLLPYYSQMLLAHPSSFHSKRSEYGAHAVWVTRYSDEEFYPSGKHTMQSSGNEGIATWLATRKADPHAKTSVKDEDIVVWHTFGSTHNPRIEDWPVMPCEKMIVGLKPLNFFDKNPALDLALSTQDVNRSVVVDGGSTVSEKACSTACA